MPGEEARRRYQHEGINHEQPERETRIPLSGKIGVRHQNEGRGDGGLEDFKDFGQVSPCPVGGVEPRLVKSEGEYHQRRGPHDERVLERRLGLVAQKAEEARRVGQPEGDRQRHHVGGDFDGRIKALKPAKRHPLLHPSSGRRRPRSPRDRTQPIL